MSKFILTPNGWSKYTPSVYHLRRYYAKQAMGKDTTDSIPIIKSSKKAQTPVQLRVVSNIQNNINRTKAEVKHIKENTKHQTPRTRSDLKGRTSKPKHKKSSKRL